jgi:hypothetical protein
MPNITGTRAAADFPAFKALGAGVVCAAYGSVDLAVNPTIADIIQLAKLPAGAVVLGGFFRMEDIDTNATETIDIDIGWAANGAVAADPDGFGNFGPRSGDAVTDYLPEGGVLLPLNGTLKDGFPTFTRETIVTATVVAAAATFAAGTISVVVWYVCP